jgi:transcriptional regulator NrdR
VRKTFTTHEQAEIQFPFIVKRNGSRTEFSHDKLAASLQLALRKRPVTAEAIDSAVSRIEEKLLALGEREVTSLQVGELVMRELKKLDKVAYVRFASVYRNFTDIDEFSEVSVRYRRRLTAQKYGCRYAQATIQMPTLLMRLDGACFAACDSGLYTTGVTAWAGVG